MSYDNWATTEEQPYEEPREPVDPKDEAYSEACEEIERLRKIIERMKREVKTTT